MSRPKNNICIDGAKVQKLRDELDLSQEGLVENSSVSFSLSSLQRIERESIASRDHAYQISDALGVPLKDLLIEVSPDATPTHAGGLSRGKIRILVGLGNIFDKYADLSDGRKDRVRQIVNALRDEFIGRDRYEFNISGRAGSLAAQLFNDFEADDVKRVNTFIPKLEIERSLPDESYVMIGNVYETGDYIEDRRQELLGQSDVVLITDGKRGITNLLSIAKQQRRKIVPLPFGIEFEGEFTQTCEEFEEYLKAQKSASVLAKWKNIRAVSSTPEVIATSICDLIEDLHDRVIQREIFIFFASGKHDKSDAEKIEASLQEFGLKMGFKATLVRSSMQSQLLSRELGAMMLAAEMCIAIVDHESSMLHAILGISTGMDKPLILARRIGMTLDSGIRYDDFDQVHWDNTQSLIERLETLVSTYLENRKIIL